MTLNDALTRSHTLHYDPPSSPSLKRLRTRSPSPAIAVSTHSPHGSRSATLSSASTASSKQSSTVTVMADATSSSVSPSPSPMKRKKSVSKRSTGDGLVTANGHASVNGNATSNGHLEGVEEHDGEEIVLNEVDASSKTSTGSKDGRNATAPVKIDWEIPRKTLHSSIGFLTLSLYIRGGTPQPVIVVLTGTLAIVASADFLRFRFSTFEALYETFLGFLMRESEKHKINGVVWYLVGVLFALYFYPMDIAVVAILILSWADTAASTIGRLYGRYTPALPSRVLRIPIPFVKARYHPRLGFASRKSTAGFMAAALTGLVITTSFWGYFGPLRAGFDAGSASVAASEPGMVWTWKNGSWGGLAVLGVVAGLISGVTEALDLGCLDDNLTLPILSGGAIWALAEGIRWWTQ